MNMYAWRMDKMTDEWIENNERENFEERKKNIGKIFFGVSF